MTANNGKKQYEFHIGKDLFLLTEKEYGIVMYLFGNPNRLISPEDLWREAFKEEPFDCRPTICVHICHLRQKLGKYGKHIVSRYQGGYMWEER